METLLKEQKENNEGNLSQDIKAEVNDKIEKLTQEQKNLSNTLDDIIETHDRLEFEKEQFKKDLSDYKKKTDDLAKNVDNIDTIEKELKEIKASQKVLGQFTNPSTLPGQQLFIAGYQEIGLSLLLPCPASFSLDNLFFLLPLLYLEE
uniref:Uncharacterized protein n=1 Tax=Biomphalaria glabrata TaxID=6526 RepID=A0A2C9KHX7_BIOGL